MKKFSAEKFYDTALDHVTSGKADGALDQLKAWIEKPANTNALTDICIKVDTNFMGPVRRYWDKRTDSQKRNLMNLTNTPLPAITGYDAFELLRQGGFIEYQVDPNGDAVLTEKKVQEDKGKIQYLFKGFKVAKFLFPEIKVIEPFLDPMRRLHNILKTSVLDKVRQEVIAARHLREAPARNIENISDKTHQKVGSQLSLPFTPANDNSTIEQLPHIAPTDHKHKAA